MTPKTRSEKEEFLQFVEKWVQDLPSADLAQILAQPEKVALISVDLLNGFCHFGPLSSPRIEGILPAVADLFTRSWELGLRNFVLTQDSHEEQAVEFGSWPPHCIRGTAEAETVSALKELPFSDQFVVIEKNSTSSIYGTVFEDWANQHPEVDTFILVGDCTDLCIYQMAMTLRLSANAGQLQRRVIVPAECVQTYHYSVEAAAQYGGFPHDGDFLHDLFLYHMALNGVEIFAKLT